MRVSSKRLEYGYVGAWYTTKKMFSLFDDDPWCSVLPDRILHRILTCMWSNGSSLFLFWVVPYSVWQPPFFRCDEYTWRCQREFCFY